MAMLLSTFIALSLLTIGAVVILMVRLVAAGSLERNAAFGIRTSATKHSDQAWAAGHRAAQPLSRVLGITAIVFAVVILALGFTKSMVAVAVASVMAYLVTFVLIGLVARRANAAARAVS
ncbi:SdpI family protein [Actinoplanes sp. NPDC020271]|uniref:SdpI family protein n=1 Tax=Actinoplanes sp. NPDC020271 TaxID=3363896 RepID=UPI00379C0CAC